MFRWQISRVIKAWWLGGLLGLAAAEVGWTAQDVRGPGQERFDRLGDPLPPHALLRLGTNRLSANGIKSISLSNDGQVVVAATERGLIGWDAHSGRSLWTHSGDRNPSLTSAASYGHRSLDHLPNSDRVAYALRPGVIGLFDYRSGQSTAIQLPIQESLNSLDVSPDESLVACGCSKFLLVCDLAGVVRYRVENRPAARITERAANDRLAFGGEFSDARFSPDGRRLAVVNSQRPQSIQILDAESGEPLSTIDTAGYVIRFCFSASGDRLFTTEQTIAARAYATDSGQMLWERLFSPPGQDERYTTDIALSPAGDELAIGTAIGEDNRIHLVDPNTGATVGTLSGHTWKPWCLAYRSDGQALYSAGWDSVVRRWNLAERQPIRLEHGERASGVVAMAPTGKTILFADDAGTLHLVDRATGVRQQSWRVPDVTFTQLAYSADGQRLVGGGSSAGELHVYVWSTVDGQVTHHWHWPKGRDVHAAIEAVSFSQDGQRLATCSFRQSRCQVFDLPSREKLWEFRHGNVYGLSLHPSGDTLVSAGWDQMIKIWDCQSGELKQQVKVGDAQSHDPRMYGVLFAPDGQGLAALRLDSTLSIFDAELQPVRDIVMSNRATYGSFCFSHNGRWLAVGQSDGVCGIYDVRSGARLWSEARHEKYVYNVAFSPDDRTLLSGGQDGVCYLWDLAGSDTEAADMAQMVQELVGPDAVRAFRAYQRLLAEPDHAAAALAAFLPTMTSSTEDGAEGDRRFGPLLDVLTHLESAAADGLLQDLQKNGPSLAVKRRAFGALRQRQGSRPSE